MQLLKRRQGESHDDEEGSDAEFFDNLFEEESTEDAE